MTWLVIRHPTRGMCAWDAHWALPLGFESLQADLTEADAHHAAATLQTLWVASAPHRPIDDVADEIRRQIEVKGYTAAHDDQYSNGELAEAGAAYALSAAHALETYPSAANPAPGKLIRVGRERMAVAVGAFQS